MAGSYPSPPLKSKEIEEALQRALGDASGPQGLVVTLRRHEDYERLLLVIDDLQDLNSRLKADLQRMGDYAHMYFRALDDLRLCRREMERQGLDTSFITSFK